MRQHNFRVTLFIVFVFVHIRRGCYFIYAETQLIFFLFYLQTLQVYIIKFIILVLGRQNVRPQNAGGVARGPGKNG